MDPFRGLTTRNQWPAASAAHHTAPTLNSIQAIDSLSLGSCRRSLLDIRVMVDRAKSNTQSSQQDDGCIKMRTTDSNAYIYRMESEFNDRDDALVIKNSFKTIDRNNPNLVPNASDAYLAHLSIVHESKTGRYQLPPKLPEHLVQYNVRNPKAELLSQELRGRYPGDGQGKIKIQLNRQNPSAQANADLYRLLADTDNGKSTTYLIKDFNNLQRTQHIVESAEISFNPLRIDFTIGEKR